MKFLSMEAPSPNSGDYEEIIPKFKSGLGFKNRTKEGLGLNPNRQLKMAVRMAVRFSPII